MRKACFPKRFGISWCISVEDATEKAKLSRCTYMKHSTVFKTLTSSVLVGLIQLLMQLTYPISLERRWSSRTFRYGYLVTTSPQLSIPPSAAPSLRLGHWLRALSTPMVWRAVCTRPGNVFTAAFWSAITSDSSFMQASCSLQSELRRYFWDLLPLAGSLLFVYAIVARV